MKKLPEKLYKTTVVIWSDFDGGNVELEDLAREATSGSAYCTKQKAELVDPRTDPEFDGSDFFGFDEEEEDGKELGAAS